MSPITKASGTKRIVLARYARNRRLGDALFLQAFAALNHSPGARAFYDRQRARGATHYQALRALANRLVGILHGCKKKKKGKKKMKGEDGMVLFDRSCLVAAAAAMPAPCGQLSWASLSHWWRRTRSVAPTASRLHPHRSDAAAAEVADSVHQESVRCTCGD